MPDQANDLRQRMHACAAGAQPARRLRWLAVVGGKGGVGTTTVAWRLATAAAAGRTLLVDADPRGGDLALQCGVDDRYTIHDLLSGRRTLPQVLRDSPSGLRIVPGACGWEQFNNSPAALVARFQKACDGDDVAADALILDLGNTLTATTSALAQSADAVVVVTTPEAAAVVGAYETIKRLAGGAAASLSVLLFVNRATPAVAESVCRRLAQAARRFLGVPLVNAGYFPVKEKRTLNLCTPQADTVRELSACEPLLNWTKQSEFGGVREAGLWHDSMQESSVW